MKYIEALVGKVYYPQFGESATRAKLTDIVQRNFTMASRLLDSLKQSPDNPSITVAVGYSDPDSSTFIKEFAKAGLGFPVDYTSASGQTHSDELVFREKPLTVKPLFIEILERELKRRLLILSDAEKWCVYLRYMNPSANGEFFVINKARFTIEEIRLALKRILHIQTAKQSEILSPILNEIRENFSLKIRQLFLRDINVLTTFSLFFQLANKDNLVFKLGTYQLDKLKEIFFQKIGELGFYLEDLQREGIILKHYSDYWIPEFVREIFVQETRGNILEVKIFSSRLDAEVFFYDLFGKAEQSIRIWDPYFSPETFNLLNNGLRKEQVLRVEILTSCPSSSYASPDDRNIHRHLRGLQAKAKVQIKVIFSHTGENCISPFHDRFVIIDGREVWSLGSSLSFIGEKGELALQLKEGFGKLMNAAFDNYWKTEVLEGWRTVILPRDQENS